MNSSSEILHPNEKEGKYPYLLLEPNLEEPSALKFTVARYLSANE